MKTLIPANNKVSTSAVESVMNALSHIDSKALLAVGSMVCLTTVLCIGFVCFSGSQMTLSKDGLSITQPNSLT